MQCIFWELKHLLYRLGLTCLSLLVSSLLPEIAKAGVMEVCSL